MPPNTPPRPLNGLPPAAERARWVSWLIAHGYPLQEVSQFIRSGLTREEMVTALIRRQRGGAHA